MTASYTEYSNVVYHQHSQPSTLPSQHVNRMGRTSKDLLIGSNDMNKLYSQDPRTLASSELSPIEDNRTLEVLTKTINTTTTTNTQTTSCNTPLIRQSPSSLAPTLPSSTPSPPTRSYFTWLVFLKKKWVPFDDVNQSKLEQTLSLGGTFVDISDSNFEKVKRVRVFPKNNYLSYLGVKYRLSRIMQPDAWLDHVNLEREARVSGYRQSWE